MYIANQANPADILKLHNQQEDTILDDVDDTSEDEDEDDEYDGEFVSQETRSDLLETGDSDSDIDDKENNNHTNSETKDTSDSKPAIIKKQKVIKRPRGSEYKLIRYFVLFDLTNLELVSGKSQLVNQLGVIF